MMKKFLKVILSLILAVALVGCSSNDDIDDSDSTTSSETADETEDTEESNIIDIVAGSFYVDTDYVIYYVGVQNSSENQTFAYPGVKITTYDEDDNELESEVDLIGEGIAAGDTVYYYNIFYYEEEFTSLNIKTVESVDGYDSGLTEETYPSTTDFEITSSDVDGAITGTITNNGDSDVEEYMVVVIFTQDGYLEGCNYELVAASGAKECNYSISSSDVDYDTYLIYCYATSLM